MTTTTTQAMERVTQVAEMLWDHFAPSHHIEWKDEPNKTEYLRTAQTILSATGNHSDDKLTAAEAIFGFAAWLTSLKHPVTLGATEWATPAVDLAVAFIKAQELGGLREDYNTRLKQYPKEPDSLSRALSAAAPAPQAAPPVNVPGWKLVPVEPTEEMLAAGYGHHYRLETQLGSQKAHIDYRYMIAAAPSAPQSVAPNASEQWVIVPKEPHIEQVKAGQGADPHAHYVSDIYRCMLSAAPSAPVVSDAKDAALGRILRANLNRHERDDGSNKDLYVLRFSAIVEANSEDEAIAAIAAQSGKEST